MFRSNEEGIKSKFADLLNQVQSALKANNVEVDDVRNHLIRLLCPDDVIPKATLSDIFNAITVNNLWSYEHHSPVEALIRDFIPDHLSLMTPYKQQLSGFHATIKLVEYIQAKQLDEYDSDTEMDVGQVKKYTPKQYRRLTVKLNISGRKMSQISMCYVQELWISFAEEFDIPSLTAIIDEILEGSLKIVWLVLPHVAELISTSAQKSVQFFRRHDIIYVAIDDHVVYDVQLIVSLTILFGIFSLSFSLCRMSGPQIRWMFLHL